MSTKKIRVVEPGGRVWEWTWPASGNVDEHSWIPVEGPISSSGMLCETDSIALHRAAGVLDAVSGSVLSFPRD